MKKLLLLAVFTPLLTFAQDNTPDLTLLKQGLNPAVKIGKVSATPIAGIFEVQVDKDIIYLSADGEKVINGEIYDLKKQISYTGVAKNKLRQAALATVSADDRIIYKAKNEKYVVSVFTDISCPYCTKLHEDMAGYNDAGITIEYLAYPRTGLGSKVAEQMQAIWCADDKALALTEAKTNKQLIASQCEGNQVAEQFKLGVDIGVNATPTMVFSDGELQSGYMPPAQLLQLLQAKFNTQKLGS